MWEIFCISGLILPGVFCGWDKDIVYVKKKKKICEGSAWLFSLCKKREKNEKVEFIDSFVLFCFVNLETRI